MVWLKAICPVCNRSSRRDFRVVAMVRADDCVEYSCAGCGGFTIATEALKAFLDLSAERRRARLRERDGAGRLAGIFLFAKAPPAAG